MNNSNLFLNFRGLDLIRKPVHDNQVILERIVTHLVEKVLFTHLFAEITCDSCFKLCQTNQLICCSNNHGFCVDCIQQQYYTMSMENVSLNCMICFESGTLNIDDVRMCLQSDTYLKFSTDMYIKKNNDLKMINLIRYKRRPFTIKHDKKVILERIVTQLIENVITLTLAKIECKCCFDLYHHNQLIFCSNNHGFCVDCIQRYAMSMVKVSLKCMICFENGILNMDDIRMCLQPDTYIKFCKDMEIQKVSDFSKNLNNYQICPFCACFGCIVDSEIDIAITCETCNLIWCSGCRQKMHPGNCFQILEITDIDIMIQELITYNITHKCSSCKTKYVLMDGCNHITCPVCKTHSCYICGITLSNYEYGHFANNNICKLYGSDNRKNTQKLIMELIKFINKNSKYNTLIYERLKIICKSDKKLIKQFKSIKHICDIKNTSDSEWCCIQ